MDDFDIRFINGDTIIYAKRYADVIDFEEANASTSAVQCYDNIATLPERHCAIGSDTYRVDDLWVVDGVSADRTNRYEADTASEWTLEFVDDNCTWDSAITTDRSNVDADQLDLESIIQALAKKYTDEYSRSIKSREENEPQEIEDEKGGALDDFLGSFGGE